MVLNIFLLTKYFQLPIQMLLDYPSYIKMIIHFCWYKAFHLKFEIMILFKFCVKLLITN